MKVLIELTALAAAITGTAQAAESCKASVPDSYQTVGQTRLSVWFWDVYDATLLTDSGNYDWQQRQQSKSALLLSYLRDIDADDLVDTTAEEWQRLGFEHAEQDQWLEQLRNIWPDINEGDCLVLIETDNGGSAFYQGDKKLGEINHRSFTEQFLAIWLSPNSRFKEERNELIGAKS